MKDIIKFLNIATQRVADSVVDEEFGLMVTAGKDYEYEAKVDIINSGDLIKTLDKIESLKILKSEHRSELHHLFEIKDDSVMYLILIKELSQVWIKIKSKTKKIKTKNYNIPIIFRKGYKYKPEDSGYNSAFNRITTGKYFDSYNKECINYFFRYKNFFYSLSVSLAYNKKGFKHSQMEFEYEGYLQGTECPSGKETMKELELLFKNIFPYLFNRFNTETKYEALKKIGG